MRQFVTSFNRTPTSSQIFILLFCSGLFLYVFLRAYFMSFTHDESLSFSIILGDVRWKETANHHVLNTFLMGLSYRVFGDSEMALRLPNVLAFGFYITGCYQIIKQTKNIAILVFGLSILFLNPFFIDFFSLARGYGLSFGFVALSLYFLFKADASNFSPFLRNAIWSLSFATLASLADAAAVNYLISVMAIFSGQYLIAAPKHKAYSLKEHLAFALAMCAFILPLSFVVNRLMRLKGLGQLFGDGSAIQSINSLIYKSFSFSNYSDTFFLTFKWAMCIYLIIGLIAVLIRPNSNLIKSFSLTILFPLGFVLEHYFFGANYPNGRSTLLLVPIVGLFLFFAMNHLFNELNRTWKPALVILCLIAAWPFAQSFIGNMNLRYSQNWFFEASTKDAMIIVKEESERSNTKMSISNHWVFEPIINYYRRRWDMNILPADRKGSAPEADFIYSLASFEAPTGYTLLKEFKKDGSKLFLRKGGERPN